MRPALTEPTVVDFLKRTSKPVVLDDPASQAPPDYREMLESAAIRTVAVVPIVWQDELMGMMYFASYRVNGFGEEDLALMTSIASELAPTIQVATLNIALQTSYRDLKDAHLQALLRLAYAAEARDPYTECHLQRIRATAIAIAGRMGVEGSDLEALGYGAVVHDLGKLRIPDSILTNPGTLSDEEWAQMKQHPEWGAEIIGENAFYDVARQVALCHHERWDGSGYPRGLSGEAIPLAARVVAVADVYDALTSARPYKRAWQPERALVELMRLRGKTLCPQSVDVFMELWREGEIARIDEETQEDSMEMDFRSFYAA
jgi:HD-GYP domain-containing protein (c-di-GMP phosphodiesterase class II)